MAEPIILTYKHTESEYTSAARFFYARTIHTKLNLLISVIALLSGLLGALLTGDSVVWFILIFAGLMMLVFSYYSHFVTPRLHYKRNPKFREQYNLQFSDDGIWFRSKGLESRLDWGFYSKVWETPRFYFLIYGKHMFTLIPKRAFSSEEQELAFRCMLKRKIGSNIETFNLASTKVNELEKRYEPPPDWR